MDPTIGDRAKRGDKDAFTTLVVRHGDRLFSVAYRILRVSYGTAEDPLGRYHQGPGQIDELWMLEVGGRIVVIDAMYRPDTPAVLIAEMRAIAGSTTFE